MPMDPRASEPNPLDAGQAVNASAPGGRCEPEAAVSTQVLVEQLQADRLWLLRQIDAGK